MGHLLLGPLPKTRQWRQVVALIDSGADLSDIAKSVIGASDRLFQKLTDDPGLNIVFWLLTQIPLAAKRDDFAEALNSLGISVSEAPGIFEIASAFNRAFAEQLNQERHNTDVGEIAASAATESLISIVSEKTDGLFGRTPDDVQAAFAHLAEPRQFARLSRIFFSKLSYRYLAYFLSRELSNHICSQGRFENTGDLEAFNKAMMQHCWETAKIVEGFSAGWFTKAQTVGIDSSKVRKYLWFALEKLKGEFERGDDSV